MIKLVLFLLLSLFLVSCMKYRCYECTDSSGEVVDQGCDKKAEEVQQHALDNDWECKVLPD